MPADLDIGYILLSKMKRTTKLYSRFFNWLDDKREDNESRKEKKIWDDSKYYIPYYFIKFEMGNRYKKLNEEEQLDKAASLITAIYTWRCCKKIYDFDPELVNILIDQDIASMIIDSNFLEKLPFNGMCMYIHDDNYFKNSLIFVCIDSYNGVDSCISFYPINPRDIEEELHDNTENKVLSCESFKIPLLNGKTISEAITKYYKKNKHLLKDYSISDYRKFSYKVMNLLLYILAANADVEPREYQPAIDKAPKMEIDVITDMEFKSYETVQVGVNVGNAIRLHRERANYKDSSTGKQSNRVPHIRSGHWHKYYVGERGPKGQNKHREFIIKWIAPIFVNGYNEKTNIVNISKVVKEEDKRD